MPEHAPHISAILVSYGSRAMTLDALAALHGALRDISAEIWVVDNASNDGTIEAIRVAFPRVKIIANAENKGFGAANNQAMRMALGRYFLLLNTDAFVDEAAIAALMDCLDRHPDAAMAGPRLLNRDGSLQQSCFHFPSPSRVWRENLWLCGSGDYRAWTHDAEREVEWIGGACMLVRRQAYEQVGGFDERFFLYSEETDWQRRMRSAGYRIVFTPAARVTHLGGASGAGNSAVVNRHFFKSLDDYQLKHHGLVGLMLLRAAMVVGCAMRAGFWTGAWLIIPRRRTVAGTKIRLHCWLVRRQLTDWRLTSRHANASRREPAKPVDRLGVV